jgi:hypothetical protein
LNGDRREALSYGSFNQPWHKCQSGRADLVVSQKAAQQRRPAMRSVKRLWFNFSFSFFL